MSTETVHDVDEVIAHVRSADERLTALEAHPAIAGAPRPQVRSADQRRAVVAALRAQIDALIGKRALLERESVSGSSLQAGMAGGAEQLEHDRLSMEIQHLTRELEGLAPTPAVRPVFQIAEHIGSTSGWQITDGRLTFHVEERPDAEAVVAALNRDAARAA